MFRRILALLAFLLCLPATPVAAEPLYGPRPAGAAHFITDGVTTLGEAQLTATPSASLAGARSHTYTATFAASTLMDTASVRLIYTTDGQDPTLGGTAAPMAFQGTNGAGNQVYQLTFQPSQRAASGGAIEKPFRFVLTYLVAGQLQKDHGPQGQGYAYVDDAQAPVVSGLQVNGRLPASIAPGDPASIQASLTDLGGIAGASADVVAETGAILTTLPLAPAGTMWQGSAANGLGLPGGLYGIRIRATDNAGNTAVQLTPDALAVGTRNPLPIPGDAHAVAAAGRELRQAHLMDTRLHGLPKNAPHQFQVLLDAGLPARVLSARLHYTTDGSTPQGSSPSIAMTPFPSGPGHSRFQATLTPAELQGPGAQNTVRFHITVTSSFFPPLTDGPYAFLDDGQAPAIQDVTFDGKATYTSSASTPVDVLATAQDPSPLAAATLALHGPAGPAATYTLTPTPGGMGTHLANGFGVPAATYDAVITVTDEAGNTATATRPGAVRIGRAPAPHPDGVARSVTAAGATLYEDRLLRPEPSALAGDGEQTFQISLEPPQAGDTVAVSLLYNPLGGPVTDSSTAVSMDVQAQGASSRQYRALLGPAALHPDAQDTHPVSFRFQIRSAHYGTYLDPPLATPPYAYLWDAQAPAIEDVKVNGQAAATISGRTPVTLQARIQDPAGIQRASLQVLAGATTVFERELVMQDTDLYGLAEPAGLGLPDGTYDLRVTATDRVGHPAPPKLVPRALTVTNQAPGLSTLLLNGQNTLQQRSDAPLTIQVQLERPAATAALAFLDATGNAARTYALTQTGPQAWATTVAATNLPTGSYAARATATDDAGNERASTTPYLALTIDDQAPTLQLERITYAGGSKDAASHGDAVQVRIRAYDDNIVRTVTLRNAGQAVDMVALGGALYAASFAAEPGSGTFPLVVAGTDAAGNLATLGLGYMRDNTLPRIEAIQVQYPTDTPTSAAPGQAVTLSIRAGDDTTRVARVLVDASRLDPALGLIDAVHAPDGSTWRASFQVAVQDSGAYPVTVVAFDDAQNKATLRAQVLVQTGGPVAAQYAINGHTRYAAKASGPLTIAATFLPGANVASAKATIEDSAGNLVDEFALRMVDATHYAATHQPDLGPGRYHVSIQARDTQGRSGTASDPEPRITIDPTGAQLASFTVDATAVSGESISLRAVIHSQTRITAVAHLRPPSGATHDVQLQATGDPDAYAASVRVEQPGAWRIQLEATDEVGTTLTAEKNLTVLPGEQGAPGPVLALRRLDGDPLSFAWNAPAGSLAGYAIGLDAAPGIGITTRNTTWTPAPLSPGPHYLSVAAVSSSGAKGAATRLNFTIAPTDSGPQDPPTTSPPTGSSTLTQAPAAPAVTVRTGGGQLTVTARVDPATYASGIVQVLQGNRTVAQANLTGAGTQRNATLPSPGPGAYQTRILVTSSDGRQQALPGPDIQITAPGGSSPLLPILAAAALAGVAFLAWRALRRRKKPQAPAPNPEKAKRALRLPRLAWPRNAKPAPRPTGQVRGVEDTGAATRNRRLPEQERASVGDAGRVVLYEEGKP